MTDTIRNQLLSLVRQNGLAQLPGKVLYSGLGTVSPGRIYFLGFNPGGDPKLETLTVEEHLRSASGNFNEYLDAKWLLKGKPLPPGGAKMQKSVVFFLKELGFEPRDVCASNVVFSRSHDIASLADSESVVEKCWPVHDWIIHRVMPKAIITMGDDAYQALSQHTRSSGRETAVSAEWATLTCRRIAITIGGRRIHLIRIPHLSRYTFKRRPRPLAWVRSQVP